MISRWRIIIENIRGLHRLLHQIHAYDPIMIAQFPSIDSCYEIEHITIMTSIPLMIFHPDTSIYALDRDSLFYFII